MDFSSSTLILKLESRTEPVLSGTRDDEPLRDNLFAPNRVAVLLENLKLVGISFSRANVESTCDTHF